MICRGGGIDLLLGAESAEGLRWPDIQVSEGRLSWPTVRQALPRQREVSVLSGSRRAYDIQPAAVEAFVEAARLAGVTVVCDLSNAHTDAARTALEVADLVVVVAELSRSRVSAPTKVREFVDVISAVDGTTVQTPEDFYRVAESAAGARRAIQLSLINPERTISLP